MSAYRPSAKGFTLGELLVVLTLLAILAALLFPVFSSARRSSRMTACASNLHQLALALGLYQQDYEALPPPVPGVYSWSALLPYTKSTEVTHCPYFWTKWTKGAYSYKAKRGYVAPRLDSNTVVAYCTQHLDNNGVDAFDLYSGMYVVVRGDGSTKRVDGKQISCWVWWKDKWITENESVEIIPHGQTFWLEVHFPGEPWPPEE